MILFLFSLTLALRTTEVVYNIGDMEPISLRIDSTAIIRYTYTPIHNNSPLLCINLTSYTEASVVSVFLGEILLLSTTNNNMTAIPLEAVASLIQLSDSSTSPAIDFTVHTTAPTNINFTAGLFKQLIYGKSMVISGGTGISERVIALANDGLHDIFLTFSKTGTDSADTSSNYLIDLHSQPFATKKESLVNPTSLLIRSVGNTYQYVAAADTRGNQLTPPKHLFMESSFYYLTVNLYDPSSVTVSYVERYQRFTPSLQIDYYNVPIHYTVDISDYKVGTQILMSSTCLDVEQAIYSPITICLRYNILSRECSLQLQSTLRYAWMTVQEVNAQGYLSSIYVSPSTSLTSLEASDSGRLYNSRNVGSCKIFLTNVNFVTSSTENLSFINKNNRNKETLLIIENPGWIEDELIVVITLRPFYEVSIENFHPYVQFFLSTKIVYPNETHNSLAYVMNFHHFSGDNYQGSSVITSYLEEITNKSAVLRIRLKDLSVQLETDSIYIKLEHSVDLDLLFLNDVKPSLLEPGILYGADDVPLSALNSYYIDSGHTTGVSTLSGYIYFDVCSTTLFLSNQSSKKPVRVRLTDNLDQSESNFLEILVPITRATTYVPVYSSYATFVKVTNTEYVSSTVPYKIGYVTEIPAVIVGDSRVRIHSGLMSDIIEVDSAKAPAQAYTTYSKEGGIYLAYAAYLVPSAFVNGSRQDYPTIPISKCGLEAALIDAHNAKDMNTPGLVRRVSNWVVAPAADNTEVYTPEFLTQADNTWSMLHISINIPSYKYEPYYLVVVAAVDTNASRIVNQPVLDPIWEHTIDKTSIRFYETRYLSSSFSSDDFISFVGYHSAMPLTLVVVFWSIAALFLLIFVVTLSLFLKYRYKYERASRRTGKAVQLVNRELSIEYSHSRLDSSDMKHEVRRTQTHIGQIDQAYSSMDNMSSHTLPLLPSYSPSQSAARQMTIADLSHPFSKDLSSQDSALDQSHRITKNRKQ